MENNINVLWGAIELRTQGHKRAGESFPCGREGRSQAVAEQPDRETLQHLNNLKHPNQGVLTESQINRRGESNKEQNTST